MSRAMASKHVQDLEARLGVRLMNRTTRRVGRRRRDRPTSSAAAICSPTSRPPNARRRASGRADRPAAHQRLRRVRFDPRRSADRRLRRAPSARRHRARARRPLRRSRRGRLRHGDPHRPPRRQLAAGATHRHHTARHRSLARLHRASRHAAAPADLTGHACLRYAYANDGDVGLFGADGRQTVRIASGISSNSGEALCQMAVSGLGIVRAPDFIVAPHLGWDASSSCWPTTRLSCSASMPCIRWGPPRPDQGACLHRSSRGRATRRSVRSGERDARRWHGAAPRTSAALQENNVKCGRVSISHRMARKRRARRDFLG